MNIIRNNRHYRKVRVEYFKARAQRDRLARNLERSSRRSADEVEIQRLETTVESLRMMLLEYRTLSSGEAEFPDLEGTDNLGVNLIRARIAIGWNLSKLAAFCGLKPQQIQRYEATLYAGAKLSRLIFISNILRHEMPRYREGSRDRNNARSPENDSAGLLELI